jgi:mannose-1-phosphate guanylyltransferase
LQQAVDRTASIFGIENTYIATGEPWAGATRNECPALEEGNLLVEPAKRNTLGCLIWATANLMATHEDWSQTSMAVLTADHRITPIQGFQNSVAAAMDTAEETGGLVTIGIVPNRPETGYGYLELGESANAAHAVQCFKEKPGLETAQEYVASGKHLWNSGMFFWTLPAFLAGLQAANPAAFESVTQISSLIKVCELDKAKAAFNSVERAPRVFVVKAEFDWDDLGTWDALKRTYPRDESGNVTYGPARLVESNDSVVYNESEDLEVCLLGVEGLVVVVTKDKVMVCPADRAQDVRKLSES